MGKTTFQFFNRTQEEVILPQMFDILFTNMNKIAPTGDGYAKDKQEWIAYMTSEAKNNQQIILMYVDEILSGYFQYSIINDTMLIEEIEVTPKFQRTLLFYSFIKYMSSIIPKSVIYIEAYVNKRNENSMVIAKKLGMQIMGENRTETSWHFHGKIKKYHKLRVGQTT